jgi:hypothetical protein
MSGAIELKRYVLGKIDAVYGTDPVPTVAANAILVKNLNFDPGKFSYASRKDLALPAFGKLASKTAHKWNGISFDVEVSGAAAAGTAPPYGPLLRGCGLSETIVASTSVTYAPVSSSLESVTMYGNKDGMLSKFISSRGSVALVFENEEIPVWRHKFASLYSAPADVAMSAQTLTAHQEPQPMNKTLTTSISLHGYACGLWAATLDMGNVFGYVPFPGGSEQVFITDAERLGSVEIEYPTVAQKDFHAIVDSGATGSFSLVHGTGAGKILTVTAGQVRLTNPRGSNRRGVRTLIMDLECPPTLAFNNEFSFAHT